MPSTGYSWNSKFVQLSDPVYYYRPEPSRQQDASSPSLVLLFPWLNATPRHILKYTSMYQELYPDTPIMLITTDFREMFSSVNVVMDSYRPANNLPSENILVHIFSNGGSYSLTLFAEQYLRERNKPLPMSVLIIDSAPGGSSFHDSIIKARKAFSVGLPKPFFIRWPLMIFITLVLFISYIWNLIRGKKQRIDRVRGKMNDERVLRKEAPRWYIYSKGDKLIGWQHVEKHIKEAKSMGYTVKSTRWDKEDHVSFLRTRGDEYVQIVKNAWAQGTL